MVNYTLSRYFITLHEKNGTILRNLNRESDKCDNNWWFAIILWRKLVDIFKSHYQWFTCISSRTLRPLPRLNTGKKNIGLTDLCDFLCFISLEWFHGKPKYKRRKKTHVYCNITDDLITYFLIVHAFLDVMYFKFTKINSNKTTVKIRHIFLSFNIPSWPFAL